MAHFIPCKSNTTSKQLAELHIKYIWPLHGLPLVHNTDHGMQFIAPYMQNLYKSLSINQRLSTAYHPESQGQVKSNNKWLETYLHMFSAYQQDDWADYLHTAEFAYNNHFHPLIDATPFYANYGYHPIYTDRASPEQVTDLPMHLKNIYKTQAHCQLALDKAQQLHKRYMDRKHNSQEYTLSDKVWLELYNLSTDAPSKKLGAKRLGPYDVLEQISPSSYHISILANWQVHNVFHASLLSCTKSDTMSCSMSLHSILLFISYSFSFISVCPSTYSSSLSILQSQTPTLLFLFPLDSHSTPWSLSMSCALALDCSVSPLSMIAT